MVSIQREILDSVWDNTKTAVFMLLATCSLMAQKRMSLQNSVVSFEDQKDATDVH